VRAGSGTYRRPRLTGRSSPNRAMISVGTPRGARPRKPSAVGSATSTWSPATSTTARAAGEGRMSRVIRDPRTGAGCSRRVRSSRGPGTSSTLTVSPGPSQVTTQGGGPMALSRAGWPASTSTCTPPTRTKPVGASTRRSPGGGSTTSGLQAVRARRSAKRVTTGTSDGERSPEGRSEPRTPSAKRPASEHHLGGLVSVDADLAGGAAVVAISFEANLDTIGAFGQGLVEQRRLGRHQAPVDHDRAPTP
jgi:hypothetical protein